MTVHHFETDLLVAGGGLAGVCAALAAARNGARVILIQDRSVLGGNASSEIRMHAVGADCHGHRPGARESGIIEELVLEDAARNPQRSFSQWDLLLYEKVHLEPNIELLLDTHCAGATVHYGATGKRTITEAKAIRSCTEDEFHIRARYFADCTGDGRLGFEAGAEFMLGRESRDAYNESLASEHSDDLTLGSSILFTARRYDSPQPYVAPTWTRRFTASDFKHRPIHSYEYGYWWCEWGGHLNTIKDGQALRHELLRIALGVWDYVKNSGAHPDSTNWALEWVGCIPGKRESRRFLGPHVLTQHDLLAGRIFEDQVAYGGWAIDLHPPHGVDVPDEPPFTPTYLSHLYTIPLRCYYSRNLSNLFFAGRNISATHIAFASTRVMKTCAIGGQAIGTAAALWLCSSASNDIATLSTPERLHALQQTLLRDDAFLPGLRNEHAADLARTASVQASSETEAAPASRVVDGITRDLKAAFGRWAEDGVHHWESLSLPASLTLTWPAPVSVREIHLTFDSGFERQLCITPSDHTNATMVRGAQPELVKHYRLRCGNHITVEETNNVWRKRVHRLPASESTSSVTLEIEATHGVSTARVFEIRIYG